VGGPLLLSTGGPEFAAKANDPDVRSVGAASQVTGAAEPQIHAATWMKLASGGNPQKVAGWLGNSAGFGTKLHDELGVPVGIIVAGVGGTYLSCWTSEETIRANPAFKAISDIYQADGPDGVETLVLYDDADTIVRWKQSRDKAVAAGQPSPAVPRLLLKPVNYPSIYFNDMIQPLSPYAIRGVIWYQGENDAGMAEIYRKRLPALIDDWRQLWGDSNLPFVITQIAYSNGKPFTGDPGDSHDAELREAQLFALDVPHTSLVTTIDLMTPTDGIHYQDKLHTGYRMALSALGSVYGKPIEPCGPIYDRMAVEGGTIRLFFKHLGGGLVDKGGPLKGFSIAGQDRKWYWADATIDGDSVVVRSDKVPAPEAVRYAWTDTPTGANLYNKAGLPSPSFRTDDWPMLSTGLEWTQRN
jgi:sialate O-acetylesterase